MLSVLQVMFVWFAFSLVCFVLVFFFFAARFIIILGSFEGLGYVHSEEQLLTGL